MNKAEVQSSLDSVLAELGEYLSDPPEARNIGWVRKCEQLNRTARQFQHALDLLDRKESRDAASASRP